MSDKFPMTPKGHAWMKAELKRLKEVERPRISKDIEIARGHGDLSENADYDAAKEAQGLCEARVREYESKLALSEVIDPEQLSGDRVTFAATVTIEDADSGEEKTYTIVGEHEANIKKGRIAFNAPISRALIGKEVGDIAIIKAPGGTREVEIVDVKFLPVD
ncbi:MAG: transcription elongation factor GreA [Deltaproteobacteria bacterium]|nr:transcription elongation factor GreA [Deltaproteobacteria bacterium]